MDYWPGVRGVLVGLVGPPVGSDGITGVVVVCVGFVFVGLPVGVLGGGVLGGGVLGGGVLGGVLGVFVGVLGGGVYVGVVVSLT